MTLSLILLIVATVLLGACAFGANTSKVHLGWLGLAFFAAASLA